MKDLHTLSKRSLKKCFAAHHYMFHTKDIDAIAEIVNVNPRKVRNWTQTAEWEDHLEFWGKLPKLGDLMKTKKIWKQLIRDGVDTCFPTLQDDYLAERHRETPPADIAHYQHRPYTVSDLSEDQIRQRVADFRREGYKIARYTPNQHLPGYRWWLYPNFEKGVFSQAFARVNVVHNLVSGTGEETHLICIDEKRLTISKTSAHNVAIASDKRLLVCL